MKGVLEPEENQPTSPKTGRNMRWFIVPGFAVVFSIIGGGYYYYYNTLQTEQAARLKVENTQNFIPSETSHELNTNGKTGRDIAFMLGRERVETTGKLGSLVSVYFSEEESGLKKYLTAQEFLTQTGTDVPALLLRSLDPRFTTGIHIFDGNQMFLVLKINSYENAFAGMLEWEENIETRLLPLLRPAIDLTYPKEAVDQRSFRDSVIRNRDVRVLQNELGRTLMLYAFTDQKTLVIATSPETLIEVATRLNTRTVTP